MDATGSDRASIVSLIEIKKAIAITADIWSSQMQDQSNNPKSSRAVLLIPGFNLGEKGIFLYRLGKQLEKRGIRKTEDFESDEYSLKQFDDGNYLINIYEAHRSDYIDDITKMQLTEKIQRGVYLTYYWVFSGVYRAFRESKLLVLMSTVFILLFISWYFVTALLIFSQAVKEVDLQFLSWFKPWAGWVWLCNTVLVSALPVNSSATLLHFFERYLEDEFTQYKIEQRVSKTLEMILESRYENLIIIGQSSGAMIGANLFTTFDERLPICFITLGSPLRFFSFISTKLKHKLTKLVEDCKNKVDHWIDYYSSEDLICIKWLPEGRYDNLEIKTIHLTNLEGKKISSHSIDSLTGRSHEFYLYSDEVIERILNLTT